MKILENEEATWRLKSITLWLEKGDEKSKFFHQFTSNRKTNFHLESVKY
jgi:hypothetical protein